MSMLSETQTIEALRAGLDAGPEPAGSWDDVVAGRSARRRRRRTVAASVLAVVAVLAGSVVAVASFARPSGPGRPADKTSLLRVPTLTEVAENTHSPAGASIAVGGGAVFAVDWDHGRLLRYGAGSLRATGRLTVGGPQNSVLSITYGGGSLWALDFSTNRLLRIEPASLAVTRTTPISGQISEVAYGDGSVWVTSCCRATHSRDRQLLERIDPSTGQVTGQVALSGSGQALRLAVGNAVAVSGETGPIHLVDPATMRVLRSVPNPGRSPDPLAAIDGQVYALTLHYGIRRLDPGSGRSTVVALGARDGFDTGAGRLVSAGGNLWLSTGSRVYRVDPTTGRRTAQAFADGIGDIAATPTSLYVSARDGIERFGADSRPIGTAVLSTTLTIDPGAGETFSPPTADQLVSRPALTAAQAFAKFASISGSKHTTIPPSRTVVVGALTLRDHAAHLLVYGYRGPRFTCVTTGIAPLPDPGTCVQWTFLDANTGHLVDATEQPLSGSLLSPNTSTR